MRMKKLTILLAVAVFAGTTMVSAGISQAATSDTLAPYTESEIVNDLEKAGAAVNPIGQPNTAYEKYFTGRSYLSGVTTGDDAVNVANVTFEPGSINHWHVHHGSCQVLAGVAGKGYYQIWGEPVKEITPGTNVVIPENTKHWHGAQHDSWFQHLSIAAKGMTTDWLEPVNEADYAVLK